MANLTQAEVMALRENLSAEMLMIQKYGAFANIVSDPQLKQMCLNAQQLHQRHRDMLLRHINAGQPMM